MLPAYGEDDLVAALLSRLPPIGPEAGVCIGVGEDDCAVVEPLKHTRRMLLKTDCVIEGVHFLPETPPEQVGWKALCRPLSDIAATGGKPLHALVTFAINRQRTLEWAMDVYSGIGQAAREFEVAVVGGETASSPGPCFVSVCLTGSVRERKYLTRGGGRPDDRLYVTGELGGSFSTGKHLRFRPRLEEGAWLARQSAVRAMMDLSDGLAADLPRLARASVTGFLLRPDLLPITPGCSLQRAVCDGEDYELLCAIRPGKAAKLERAWRKRFPALPLTHIGSLQRSGIAEGLAGLSGYDHFAPARPAEGAGTTA